MNDQRKKEIKYLLGTFISVIIGMVGAMLVAATIAPPPDAKIDNDYYVVGIASSIIFFGISILIFIWARKQLRK